MASVDGSELVENRWSENDWDNYELWEKIELRLRRKKLIWIAATALAFLALASIPTFIDQYPKWKGRSLARRLSQEILDLQKDSAIDHSDYRIRFKSPPQLAYVVERVNSCTETEGTQVREGSLVSDLPASSQGEYVLLSPQAGLHMGLPGLVESLCYSALRGVHAFQNDQALAGFGIVPAKDLAEGRSDRVTLLLMNSQTGEMSFD